MFHSRKICPFNVTLTDSKWGQHFIWEFNSCFFFSLSYCITISALSFVERHLAAELETKFYRQLIFEKLSFSAFYLESQAVCWMEGKPLKKPRRRRIWKRRSRHFHFHSELFWINLTYVYDRLFHLLNSSKKQMTQFSLFTGCKTLGGELEGLPRWIADWWLFH